MWSAQAVLVRLSSGSCRRHRSPAVGPELKSPARHGRRPMIGWCPFINLGCDSHGKNLEPDRLLIESTQFIEGRHHNRTPMKGNPPSNSLAASSASVNLVNVAFSNGSTRRSIITATALWDSFVSSFQRLVMADKLFLITASIHALRTWRVFPCKFFEQLWMAKGMMPKKLLNVPFLLVYWKNRLSNLFSVKAKLLPQAS